MDKMLVDAGAMIAAKVPARPLNEFVRYFLVSAVALAVDATTLLALAQWVHYALAATVSFVLGSVVHYLLSIRLVFSRRRLGDRRWAEWGTFFGAGVVALATNVAVIFMAVEWFSLPLLAAKLVAAVFSFLIGFVGRKWMLFR